MYAGIEGGGTSSKACLISKDGVALSVIRNGPETNHWQLGVEETCKRINKMISDAKEQAGVRADQKLVSLGLGLSGADGDDACKMMREGFLKFHPDVSEQVFVFNDCVASMATASDDGGVVVISGTGSNCYLVLPDWSFTNAGGYGHMLGDEGSSYWISLQGIKSVLDDIDRLKPSEHDITLAKSIVYDFFKIKEIPELLPHFYTTHSKQFIAGLTPLLAVGAREHKDALCKAIFFDAGQWLGRHVAAVLPKADKKLLNHPGGLKILCAGSVWKSWDLLKPGFLEGIKPKYKGDVSLKEFSLLTLQVDSAVGSTLLGARLAGHKLPADYEKNIELLDHIIIDPVLLPP